MNYDNTAVRRQDRLLTEEQAMEILQNGEYGILSIVSDTNAGYGIPLNYVIENNSLYFHCAPEGDKLEGLAKNNKVSFCVVGKTRVVPAKFTTAYESVLLKGTITLGLSDEEKMHALVLILDKYSPESKVPGMKYAEKSLHRTNVIRLDVETFAGKTKVVK